MISWFNSVINSLQSEVWGSWPKRSSESYCGVFENIFFFKFNVSRNINEHAHWTYYQQRSKKQNKKNNNNKAQSCEQANRTMCLTTVWHLSIMTNQSANYLLLKHTGQLLFYWVVWFIQQENSGVLSASETTGELTKGEANVPNISHAGTAAHLFIHSTTGHPARYCRPNIILV